MLVYWLVLSIGRVQAASCHTTFGVVLVLILASARTGLNSQVCSRQVQSLTGRQLKQLLIPAACQCWLSICLMAFWHTTGTSEVYQKEENKLGFFWQCHCSFPGVAVYCPLPLVPFGCCGYFKPLPLKMKEEDKLLQNKISKLFLLGLQVCQVAKEYRLHWFAVRTVRKKKKNQNLGRIENLLPSPWWREEKVYPSWINFSGAGPHPASTKADFMMFFCVVVHYRWSYFWGQHLDLEGLCAVTVCMCL